VSRIFISYRRDDSAGYAGRLYDRLSQHFGDDNVFMDIDTIPVGMDFVEVIEESVGSCDVLIALIGKQWLTITDAQGRRRLDNPEDFVRLEIKTALDRNILVIPALIRGASMPRSQDLPDVLQKLARRNALEISDRFHPEVDRLIKELDKGLGVSKSAPTRPHPVQRRISRGLLAGIGISVLVVIVGVIAFYAGWGDSGEFDNEGIRKTIIAADGAPMVLIPAGPFTMGSDSGNDDEQPVHEVTLDDFYIDQYEVTNARYADCVAAGDCTFPNPDDPHCTEAYDDSDKMNHPVVCVNWEQANTYCEWRGDRLPTEAEWEKAARGTDGQIYPWDDTAPNEELLNFNQNVNDTTPVGSYPDGVSPYGVYDMAGNVFEWVADWYNANYYSNSPSQNPIGPSTGDGKVLRGGAWDSYDDDARASYRGNDDPDNHYDSYGFRCVAAPPE